MIAAGVRGVFVVGTDTGVGKTWVAAALARAWVRAGHRVGVLKPASTGGYEAAGALRSPDADALIAAISTPGSPFPPPPHDRVAPLIYPDPLAPVAAARVAGQPLDPDALVAAVGSAVDWWQTEADAELLVVEGVGGLLCPLAEAGWTVADLAGRLDLPLILVAHRGLGTLNQTLLTVEAARARGLRVAGIILNGARPTEDAQVEATNPAVLASHLPGVPILAEWPFQNQAADQPPDYPEAAGWVHLAAKPRSSRSAGSPGSALASLSGADIDLSAPSGSDADLPTPSLADRSLLESSSSGEINHPPPTSGPAVPDLDLNLGVERPASAPAAASPGAAAADLLDDPTGPSPWKNALLASYASAMTLALLWTIYQGRVARTTPPAGVTAATTETHGGAAGKLGDRSRRVATPDPIAPDRRIELGQSRQVGSLLVEPLAIERRDLVQERVGLTGKPERRDGGKRTVALRVRLQNRSADEVFAPVDPAFVRNRADGLADSLLELKDGRKIYPGTLAVDSEWTSAGENFGDLRPGEAREVVFATEPNAPADAERLPGLWRLKLRTGLDATAVVGVQLPDRTGQ